jgi:hypothetical protein
MHKVPLYVAGIIFGFLALVHLYRYFYHFNVIIGETVVTGNDSLIAFIVLGALSLWMFSSACCKRCLK